MVGLDVKKSLVDWEAISQAYADWRYAYILYPRKGEYKCPHFSENDFGGQYVDNDYCLSHCFGKGCREKDTCTTRKKAFSKDACV